jgi:hypothetical protein
MAAPAATYRALIEKPTSGRWRDALAGPLFTAILFGTLTAMGATRRVTLGLVVSGIVCWSFVPAIQLLTGIAVIRSVRGRTASIARDVELWFLAHGPWSLCLLALMVFTLWRTTTPNTPVMVVGLGITVVWNAVILRAFCRTVLGDAARASLVRVLWHQAVTWAFVGVYIALVTQLWPRFLGALGR